MKTGWSVLLLLLLYLTLRVHQPLAQPAFVDEGYHIERAQRVWQFAEHPAQFAHGKLLLYYYLGLWDGGSAMALLPASRMAIALWSCLTAAVVYQLGRRWGGNHAGLLALALYAVTPLALWHERMALADPFAAGWLALLVWRVEIFALRPTIRGAFLCGVLLALTTLAKLTLALAVLLPPLLTLAASQFQIRRWLREYAALLLVTLLTAAVLWIPVLLPLLTAPAGDYELVSPANFRLQSGDVAALLGRSLSLGVEMLRDFNGSGGLLVISLLLTGLVIRTTRPTYWVLLAWLGLGLLPLLAADFPAARYFMPLAPAGVLTVALAATCFRPRLLRLAILSGTALWLILQALPFVVTVLTDPQQMPFQSVANQTTYQSGILNAGAEIQAAVTLLEGAGDIPAVADWEICHLLLLTVTHPVTCLSQQNPIGDLQAALNTLSADSLLLISVAPFLWEGSTMPFSIWWTAPISGTAFHLHMVQLYPQRAG